MTPPDWSLRWHHFTDLMCAVQKGPDAARNQLFVDELKPLGDSVLISIFGEDGESVGVEPHVVRAVRQMVSGATAVRPYYPWGGPAAWPPSVQVLFRRMPSGHEDDLVIGPTRVILPWPLATADAAFNERIEELGVDPGPLALPQNGNASADMDPRTDMLANAVMEMADLLVTKRPDFLRDNEAQYPKHDARQGLLDFAEGEGEPLTLPNEMRVTWDEFPSDYTEIRAEGGALVLALGVAPQAHPRVTKRIDLRDWEPCSAFGH